MRKYPEPSDYQAAIQNPNLVLREPELRAARVRLDRLGMPVVSSGGFALSFYLEAPPEAPLGEQWVVRCFKADSPDRRARYDAISRFLNANPDPMLLDVDYHEQGILVDGAWYPIVKMPLVQGVTLQRYIETEIASGRSLAHLSAKFRTVVGRLEQLGIAHGDLQHGNIMVQAWGTRARRLRRDVRARAARVAGGGNGQRCLPAPAAPGPVCAGPGPLLSHHHRRGAAGAGICAGAVAKV